MMMIDDTMMILLFTVEYGSDCGAGGAIIAVKKLAENKDTWNINIILPSCIAISMLCTSPSPQSVPNSNHSRNLEKHILTCTPAVSGSYRNAVVSYYACKTKLHAWMLRETTTRQKK